MPTPKIDFSVICDEAFVSEGTNKLNIIGIFQNINAGNLPAVHPKLTAVIRFSPDNKDHEYQLKAEIVKHKEEDKKLSEASGKMHTKASQDHFQAILNFPLLQFPSYGEYYCKVSLDDILVTKIPFNVLPTKK